MMRRLSELFLERWLKGPRRKPLVLRGARQVGKSTLVRNFAAKRGLSLCEINLERHLFLEPIFKTLNTGVILKELEALVGQQIRPQTSLLFLDEIQSTPHAIQALRYLYEDMPALPVIAAGSLLEFVLADHSFSMPVGRIEYHHVFPMSFLEFLEQIEPHLLGYVMELTLDSEIPITAHHKLMARQREYLFTGGMPEAVLVFRESQSLAAVAQVHRSIAHTYQDDFSKYARKTELALLQQVFNRIPATLGRKIKYRNFSKDERSAQVRSAILMLARAQICHHVYHSPCSGIPLHADIDPFTYKLLFLDVGLASHLCGMDWLGLQALTDRALINEGALAEQFIGQHLVNISGGMHTPRLHYWLREGKSANSEVDYVISRGPWIVPIEVKAGKSGSLKSLHQLVARKGLALAVRFDANPPSRQRVTHRTRIGDRDEPISFDLLSLPLYAVEALPRIIDAYRRQS